MERVDRSKRVVLGMGGALIGGTLIFVARGAPEPTVPIVLILLLAVLAGIAKTGTV